MWIVTLTEDPMKPITAIPPYHVRDIEKETVRNRTSRRIQTVLTKCGLEIDPRTVGSMAPIDQNHACKDCLK